ncbi:MAG: class I SAM-dependent methyltransferase [Gammaproteobacteria bacterium]|nr:class I SAM-dependent methyltransferase [Gammaproteobacteria bacterium]MCB1923875.1 class I SAM-dependent methyltransferase [Gammaproteobacteria bacterium]
MGDKNQISYLKRFMPTLDGPVLEIGSKDYGNTASFRDHFVGNEYVGIDMAEGKGVDHVLDLVEGTGDLPKSHFALAICCSVLEHVRKPWVMADNIASLVREGGMAYISVPWVWRYHAYPDDYFRFSWRGVEELFPGFDWQHIYYSTNIPDEFYEITPETTRIDKELGVKKWTLHGKRKYLPSLMVNMLGTKR